MKQPIRSSATRPSALRANRKFALHPLGVAALLMIGAPSWSLPTGGQVVSGQVTIQKPVGSTQLITQGTDKAAIDWTSFSIAAGEKVRFLQPSSSAVLLNRVTGFDPSNILGAMQANGRIFLLNPYGVVFGAGARVDVGGLVASSLSLSNGDFNAGRYSLTSVDPSAPAQRGAVRNEGVISAPGGTVALVAPEVSNSGRIEASGGRVGLAAANSVLVDVEGDGLIFFRTSATEASNRLEQLGRIQADGGSVELRATARGSFADTVLNMSGVVQAKSLGVREGKVVIDGGDSGITRVAGTVDVAGLADGQTGGSATVIGHNVLLDHGAAIDARGANGGGTVLVGGNFQGKGPERNADQTVMAQGASIDVSATGQGDGGKAVLWADYRTQFHGDIRARGGAAGGNGGEVETSGKQVLQAFGNVDAGAPRGKGGSWLLDPNNITISNAATLNFAGANPFDSTDDSASLNTVLLGTALSNGTNVTVTTTNSGTSAQAGDITVQNTTTANLLAAQSATLSLRAQRNIIFSPGAAIAPGAGALTVNLHAGTDNAGLNPGTNPSSITMDATSSINTGPTGNFAAIARGAITLGGLTVGGNLSANSSSGTGAITQAAAISVGGTSTLQAAGAAITLTNAGNNFGGAVAADNTGANPISLTDSNAIVLGTISTANNLTVNAVGITQANALTVTGTSTFNSGAGAITLTNAGNNFGGAVSANTTGANAIALRDTNAIVLGTISTTDNFTLTAGGNVTQNAGGLTVGGLTSVTAGGNDITLTAAANDFTGAVTLSNTGNNNVALRDANDVVLAASTIGNNLAVTAGGNITETGALIVSAGSATFTIDTGAAKDILLAGFNNNFQSTVISTANGGSVRDLGLRNANGGATVPALPAGLRNLDIQFTANPVTLPALTLTGDLNVLSAGDITQSGAVVVPGTATLAAGANAITLANAANNFGTVALSNSGANNVSIRDTNDIVLAASTLGQNLTVRSGGNITQTGALVVPGNSIFTIDNNNSDVSLAGFDNNLTGSITINGTGTPRDIGLRNIDATPALPVIPASLRSLDLEFTQAAIQIPHAALSGNLTVVAGGNITDAAGGVQVTGTTSLNAGAHAITLDDTANTFGGAVTLTNSGANNVQVRGSGTILLGASSVGQDLTVRAGTITQNGVLVVPGASTFTIDAINGDVLLATSDNNLTGSVTANTAGAGVLRDLALRNVNAGAAAPALVPGLRNLDLQFTTAAIALPALTLTGNLNVLSGGNITQAGAAIVPGTTTLAAGAHAITMDALLNNLGGVVSASNSGNPILLNNLTAIQLGAIGTDNNLTVTAVGITQNAGGVTVGGTTSLDGGAGVITLTTATNNFGGAVSATNSGANAIQLTDANAIVLGTINTANNLTVNAVGITQNGGGLTVGGTSSFNGGAGVVTLTTATNDFGGAVSASNSGANAIQLTDTNAIQLGTIGTANDLSVIAVGITQDSGGVSVAGASSLTGGAGVITLTTAGNNFGGAVSASNTGANAIQLTDSNAIVLGTINTANNLTVNAVGITQNGGGLTVSGSSTFNGGAGVVTLTTGSNDFGAAVSANNTGANAIQLTDTNAIQLGTINTANNLTVNAVGITQTASGLTVGGTSTFNGGAGVITLDTAATNDFTGAVSLNNSGANAVKVRDANAIVLGLSSVGQDLTVQAGSITQTGALTVPGLSTFTIDAALGDVQLATSNNNFTGAITIDTIGAGSLRDVGLRNVGAATVPVLAAGLRNLDLQFTTAAIALPATTLTGNLNVQAGGDITQTGPLIVPGTTTLAAGAHAITLTDGANNFGGAVSATNTGFAIQLADLNAIVLGTINTNNDLTVTAVGITQNGGGITVGGTTTLAGGAAAITLTTASNNFGGAVAASNSGANAIQLTDTNAIVLGAIGTTDNLTVNAVGISQTGALSVGGSSTFNGGAGAINLNDGGNDFGGPVSANNSGPNRIVLSDTNAIQLGTISTADQLTVITNNGAITQNGGGLALGGPADFHSGTAPITLLTATNDFASSVGFFNAGANDVAVRDTNDIVLGLSSVGRNFAVTAGNSIQQNGALTVPGTSNFAAGSSIVTLTTAGNDFGGAVSASNSGANAIRLTDTNAIVLGTINTANNLIVNAVGITQNVGGLTVSGTSTFNGGAAAVTLNTASNDFTGAVSLNTTGAPAAVRDASAIVLGTSSVGQDLTVQAGAISQTGVLTVTGLSTFTIDAALGDVQLAGQNNNFTGAITIGTAGAGSLRDVGLRNTGAATAPVIPAASLRNLDLQFTTSAITIPHIDITGTLNVVAGGLVDQAPGGVQVTGTTTINAGANAITLNDAANNFNGAVALTNSGANNVSVRDVDSITLGASSVGANLSVRSGGSISQSGALSVPGASTFTLDNAGSDVLLATSDNDLTGLITISGTPRDVGLRNVNATPSLPALPATLRNLDLQFTNAAVTLPTVNLTGTLNVLAGGAITQSGAVHVTGTSSLDAGANPITLTNSGNDFGAAVTVATIGANDVALRDANDIALAASAPGRNLSVTAGGNITQTGALVVTSGTGTFTIDGGAAKDVLLAGFDNDFGSTIAVSAVNGGTVRDLGVRNISGAAAVPILPGTLRNLDLQFPNTGITLPGVNLTGTLNVAAGGAIAQSGAVTAAGATTVSAGANPVALANGGNNFSSITVTGGAVSIADINALTVTSLTSGANQTVSVVAGGALTMPVGAIDTGSADLTLSSGGLLTTPGALNGRNISLTGASGLTLANNISAGGTLGLNAGSNPINQTGGAISVTGATTVAAGNGGNVTLARAGNDFNGLAITSAAAVDIVDVNALNVTALNNTLNNNVSLAAGGLLSLPGTAIAAGSGNLTLTSATSLATNGALSGNNVALTGPTGLTLGHSVTAGGTLVLSTTNSAVNQTAGSIGATGATTVTAGIGNVTLAQAGNDFSSIDVVSGGIVQVTDANALTAAAAAAGNLTLTSGGALTSSGALSGAAVSLTGSGGINLGHNLTSTGTLGLSTTNASVTQTAGSISAGAATTVTAGTGNVALGQASNDFGTINVVSGRNVTLNDQNALTASAAASATLTVSAGAALTSGGALSGTNVDLTGSTGLNLAHAVTASGTLGLHTTNAAVNQSAGSIVATGATSVGAGNGNVTLAQAGNDFSSIGVTGGVVSITDLNALTLNAISATSLTLNTAAGNGAITQTAAATVVGAAVINAGTGNVTLTQAGNDFNTLAVSGGAVSIVDSNALTVNALTSAANQAVSLVAGGNLTLPASAINSGSADLTLTSGGPLATAGNLAGANVALTGSSGITLAHNVTASGTLNLATTNAAIVQTAGVISAAGAATVNAGGGNITLAQAGNDFQSTLALTGNAISVVDTNNLTVASLSFGTNQPLSLIAGGTLVLPVGGIDTGTASLTLASNNGPLVINGPIRSGLLSLTGTAGVTLNGSVTTVGDQTYTTPVVLVTDTTFDAGPGKIDMRSSVDGGSHNFGLASTNAAADAIKIGGPVSNVAQLNANGNVSLGANVSSSGNQTYSGPLVLTADAALNAGAGKIDLQAAVDGGGHALSLASGNAAGDAIHAGAAIANASQLTTTGKTLLDADVSTTGSQTYNGAVTFSRDITFASSANGNIGFGSTLDTSANVARALTVNTGGTTAFAGNVGSANANLGSVTTDAAGTTQLGANVQTSGAQTYNDAVQLTGPVALSGSTLTLAGTVNGAQALNLNGAGGVTLAHAVGGTTPLASLAVSGPLQLNGGSVASTGAQSYGIVTLGADTVLISPSIVVAGALDGAHALTLQGSGTTQFGAAVGGTAALTSLTAAGGGSVTLAGPSIDTSGAQSYAGALLLNGNTRLTGSALAFGSTVGGAQDLQLQTNALSTTGAVSGTGTLTIAPIDPTLTIGIAGAAGALQVPQSMLDGAAGFTQHTIGHVNGSGAINANGVTLRANTTLQSASGDIRLNGSVDGAFDLTLNTGATTRIAGPVGTTTALRSLTTDNNAGAADWNGTVGERTLFDLAGPSGAATVVTSGAQTYNDPVTASVPLTLNGGAITASQLANQFDGALSSSATTLNLRTGANLKLGAVTLAGGGSIETDGTLELAGALQLNGGTLALASNATPTPLKDFTDPELQNRSLSLRFVPVKEASAAIFQSTGSTLSSAAGSTLTLRAKNGGSILLEQPGNTLAGGISAVSGTLNDTSETRFNGPGDVVLGFVRVASSEIHVAGAPPADNNQATVQAGIESDVVKLGTDLLTTGSNGQIRARLPFDNTQGSQTSIPGLTLSMGDTALNIGNGFGTPAPETWIQVEIGGTTGGYMTVRPKGAGGKPGVILLGGRPEPKPFYDGNGKLTEVRVFYNGDAPRTPQEAGALSAVTAVVEDARRARFDEAVRTENVSSRLRSGVIAEVGAGRPATVGRESIRLPDNCTVKPGSLRCE